MGNQKAAKKRDYLNIGKYAMGGVGYSMTNQIVMTYLTFFCTDIFGVSSMVVAGLMLVTKIIDAAIDPFLGIIVDHTNTKRGRYRPYLIFGSPVLAVTIYLLFSSPQMSAGMKVVFLYIAYIGYAVAFSVVGTPFTSLVPVIAKDPVDRTMAVSWKNIMIQVGRLVMTSFALPIVEFLGGGAVGWRRFGALTGIVITLCFWSVAWGLKKYDTTETASKAEEKEKLDFRKQIQLFTKNKPLVRLMISFGADLIANSSILAVNVYYFKYVLGRTDLVTFTSVALTATGVIANIFIPVLTKRFGKKKLYWWGTFFSIAPLAVLLVKPVVPTSALMVLFILFGLISTLPSSLAWAILPDCVDYAEYRTGISGNAFISAAFTFSQQLCMAVGSSLASFVLGMAGFVANQQQTAVVLFAIVFLRFGMPILGYLISLMSMHGFELTEDKNEEIQRALAQRKQHVPCITDAGRDIGNRTGRDGK